MSNLPNTYFRDISAHLMRKILDEMLAAEPNQDIDEIGLDLGKIGNFTVFSPPDRPSILVF